MPLIASNCLPEQLNACGVILTISSPNNSLMGSLVRSGLLSKVAHQCGDEASWVFLSIGDAVHAINMVSNDCMLIAS